MREVRFDVDGESVAGVLCEPHDGRARGHVVLVHGLLSQRAEFGEAPQRLAARGWRTLAIDQRGFGASGGPRGLFSQERSTADTIGAFAWLEKTFGAAPEAVVGHSMGAVFALRALAQRDSLGAGILATPMWTVRAEISDAEFFGYRAANAFSRLKTRVGFGPLLVPYKNRYRDLFADEEAARRAEAAAFLSAHVNLANYDNLIAMDAARDARHVRKPTMVLVADHDRAVKRESSLVVYEALAGEKELVRVDSGHSVWTDRASEAVLLHLDRWLRAHLPAAPVA